MASSNPPQYCLTWDEFHRDCRMLAAQLIQLQSSRAPWQGIVGIARGGMIPATIIARELNIRLIDSICISTYEHDEIGEANVLKTMDSSGAGWLLIDDLVDTGTTAKVAREMLPKATFACVYAKPAAKSLCDLYQKAFAQDTWIHFPWDCAPQYSKPLVSAHDEQVSN